MKLVCVSLVVGAALCASLVCGFPLVPCFKECNVRLSSSDDEDLDVACNETCRVDKCHEGCNLWTNAISSSCHEVCEEDKRIFNKLGLYCIRGCNIAINLYMKAIENEVGKTPAQPYLVADTRTNTTISIKWDRSQYNNISYLIQYRYDGAKHELDWEYYRPSNILKENFVKIEGLHPYTKYRFRVAWIILENYPPLFSEESIAISTLPYGAPSTPPTITCLTAVSCSRVSMSWDPPPLVNGPILSYVLLIYEYATGTTMIKDISDTSHTSDGGLHYMIINLKPSTTYRISLSTRNSMGEGPHDVRNITTLAKRISNSHHTPAYLLFGSKHQVLRQGLRIIDESKVLYHIANESVTVSGVGLYLKQNVFFVSDSQGNLHSINLKKGSHVNTIMHSNTSYFTSLSVDWLNGKIYMAEEHQITRCDTNGNNYEILLNKLNRPKNLHVDPLNGYLYLTVTDSILGGGLYRVDLIEFDHGKTINFEKAALIVSDNQLSAFAVDYKNFRLLLPSSTNNTIVSVSLDGSDVSDIRENSQTPLYKNIRSIAIHNDLLYWTTGDLLYGEELHKKENKYYINVYSVGEGPFLSLNIHHTEYQPNPIPLNPVESVQALFGMDVAKISWSNPRLLSGQGKGAWKKWLYEVHLLDHASNRAVFKVNISNNVYDMFTLKPNTTYSVKVRPYSEGGKGPWSSEFTGSTLEDREGEKSDLPYILWGAEDGLLKSDFVAQNVEPIIHKINLNNAHITDIASYDKFVFINTNTSFVYVYNIVQSSIIRLANITANSIAVDWYAPKLYYSSAANQMISRSNIDGTQPEPLPIVTMAKKIAIDSANAFIYWITSNSVERSRLNGMDHFVYMKNALFSGKHVMGLTLDLAQEKLFFMIRSFEGSVLYQACLARNNAESSCTTMQPEIIGSLSEDSLHGPVFYYNRKIFWIHENQRAFVSDINGKNFAHIEGLGLTALTSMEIMDPLLQTFPDNLDMKTIKVVPPSISENAIHVEGTHDKFNITLDPILSVNYGTVFYEIRIDDGDEVYSCITNNTVFVYPVMKRLAPFTPLIIGIQAFTYYASSKKTVVSLHSPPSIPSSPLHPRIFITYKSSPLNPNHDIVADFRWSPPAKTNGIITNYYVKCWMIANETKIPVCDDVVDGKLLQFQKENILPNTTYTFQVSASTSAGMGPPSDRVEAETSVEKPVPQLLLANSDSVKVADIDFHEEKLLFGKATHPAAIAYLAQEKRIFYLEEEGSLMASSIDGTNASLIKHLTYSEGTSLTGLTVDWIGRKLYYTEVDKKESHSTVFSVDLSVNNHPKKIFNSSSIINSLEVEPFSGSLIYTLTVKNNSNLMISDLSGSNIRPFFFQVVEYENNNNNKVKVKRERTKPTKSSCNCSSTVTTVGEAIAIDNTNTSELKVLYVDGLHGHILSSDISGCVCHLVINATQNQNSGLPPTSITVDKQNVYWSNRKVGKVFSISKTKKFSEVSDSHPLVAEEVRGIRSIRAIGHYLQPFPDASCLISESYTEKARLIRSTHNSLALYLPHVHRPNFCNRISSPSLLYTVYYGPLNDDVTQSCFMEIGKNTCQSKKTYNDTIILDGLKPFTNYSIRISVENYYSKGLSVPGPEVTYQTAVGVPSQPVNVSAKAVTPYRIDVSWEPPFIPNGSPIFYEILLKVKNSTREFSLLSPTHTHIYFECGKESSTDLSASITTTESGKDHYITVRAYSADCEMHNDSEEVIVTAFELPSNITLVEASSTSLRLSWISPADDSISNHLLEYSQAEGEEDEWKVSEITATEPSTRHIFSIKNLIPKTKYYFRLILTYKEKGLKFVWPQNYNFEFTTSGDIPSPPGKPQVKRVVKDVFKLFWDPAVNYGFSDIVYEVDIRSDLESTWKHFSNSSVTTSIVNNFSVNINYEFRVRAVNEYGASPYSYSDPFLPEIGALIERAENPFGIIIASCVAIAVFLIVFVISVYMIHLKREKCKQILQEVAPSTELPDLELATLQDLPLHANFIHQTNALYNLHDLPTDEELLALPKYKKDQIVVTKFLGSGAFGEVFEGIAISDDIPPRSQKVAIKTLKKGATEHEKQEFLKEAKLMSNFKHDHILQLIGVCFDNNPNFILLELMEAGDLLSYLRSNRPTMFEPSHLTMDDLIGICIDVARGCKYLEDMHFVHRDLAARNCLVSSYDRQERIVKIGDFGLARDIYKNDYYRKEGEGLLPVRWMAPESLVYGVFTIQSDTWAFGVLLWEVITLGMQPYPARSNMEVLYYVRSGGCLDRPDNCPDELYQIMTDCWKYDADRRPSFCSCLQVLQELRTKLASSPLIMPTVYNFDYFSQGNVGTYIGRYDPQENDENKLLDPHFDSRSTQSVPPALSEMILDANPLSMRRSLSWTSTMLQSPDIHPQCATRISTKSNPATTTNKYLELLGDNEDSDGYQLPLQVRKSSKSSKQTLPICEKICDLMNVTSISSSQVIKPSLSLNHLALKPESLNCENKTDFLHENNNEQSPALDELNLMLDSDERRNSNSISTPNSENSWLEDCDNWSFSTASTATCPLDASLNIVENSEVVAISPTTGIDMNYSSKSSYC
ncbi:proto-oncogene tyrosine-protein kinase ROS-like isoform X2 [Argiope bruennichi]|uniref:proto-oncogene tyrosine-protein kinase ROS-like isoform X2 n=1 Tax=Argiope bruennichi TaxID=94029 RepID=UPI0024942F74|nr:proto-oncogene tyrosine-protein kinase ROS-like isoform X2 [Argiope bruennichi]